MNRYLTILLAGLTLAACGKPPTDEQHGSKHPAASASASSGDGAEQRPQAAEIGSDGSKNGEILYYRHPMGLPDTSPVPKKDSMGMDYIPVYENEGVSGGSAVFVAPETIQTLGVKIEPAKEVDFGRAIRTFGAVADNARLLTEITSRVDGWIDELVITAVGDEVRKGDLLFRLRSPDLIAAKRDYVTALNSGSASWAASSATRLKSLGVQERTVAEVRTSRAVDELTAFYAERDGIVSMLNVRKGAFVKSGDQIATLADYGEVWVIASIAEQDLPLIAPGAPAAVTFPNAPAASRSAIVDYVYPTVDAKTRTGKARIVLDNPTLALRPGAYADVSFEIGSQSRLAVPSEAILRDQRGAHVILATGEGRFMAVSVKTGLVSSGLTEIVEGLDAGDRVVVSGQFLIDSESNLKESLGKLTAGGHAGHGVGAAPEDGDRTEMKSDAEPSARQHDDDGSQL
ncbi:MAG TPA: efflux RND transporter periplasmic adaptor subunit [Parvularcula sp.]|jgi:Cu(I)/Ag(I) efflux system membrane fusion protein|nr:efflux RND transporter periplasmic adaptor subunit [Parvularcula sp.]